MAASALPGLISLFPFGPTGGSAEAETVARRKAGAMGIDVTRFGATGDGITDDAPAIREAVAAVTAVHADQGGGGIVYFPAGIYAVGSPLVLPKNVFLLGDGPIASRLLYTGRGTDAFVTFGRPRQIATFTGVRGLWIDAQKHAQVSIRLHGPQEGSSVADSIVTGAEEVVLQIRSAGVEGGSNKFSVERCWLWTDGDEGRAGVSLDAGSGPMSIRDTTIVGTNRTSTAPAESAGLVATRSLVTLDNVNVEHFESHSYLDRTHADIRDPSGFFNRYGVRTSERSTGHTLLVSNANFDRAEQCILDEGSGVTLRYARSYWNEAYEFDRRQFRRNFWEVGSANIYHSASQQATVGWTSPGSKDTSRFKLTAMQNGRDWVESANIAGDGTFGSADSDWNGPHLRIGRFHLWVDTKGRLRMKGGAPEFETDGTVIGDQ